MTPSQPEIVRSVRTEDHPIERYGDGFADHGGVGFVVQPRGWVGAAGPENRDVVLVWLWESASWTGWLGYIDVDSGTYEEFTAVDGAIGAPYASLLSNDGCFYACNRHFVEFDPVDKCFDVIETDIDEGDARAMSMTEDDAGCIWAANFPHMSVVRYDPTDSTYSHYEDVYDHPSEMYPRSIAVDDAGWVYIGIRPSAGQLVILDPDSGFSESVLPAEETVEDGPVEVTRTRSGSVIGQADGRWFELHTGTIRELDQKPSFVTDSAITGSQSLAHRSLPSGRTVARLELATAEPFVHVEDRNGNPDTTVSFQPSGGDAQPMGITRSPGGSIVGGTYIPLQSFAYDPSSRSWFKAINVGQWNTITSSDRFVFIGMYPDGAMLRWDPDEPWNPPDDRTPNLSSNPAYLCADRRHVHRPYSIVAHPEERYVVLGGTPDYGHTGGGLLIWDRTDRSDSLLTHEQVVPKQITNSLVGLSDDRILGGTYTGAALGGVKEAETAELYLLDLASGDIIWRDRPLDVQRYQDLIAHDGRIFGVADRERLFVYDPETRSIEHEIPLEGQTAHQQGPSVFVRTPENRLFVLFENGTIAEVDTQTSKLRIRATAPTEIRNGGAYHDGRIYYVTDSTVQSWEVPSLSDG